MNPPPPTVPEWAKEAAKEIIPSGLHCQEEEIELKRWLVRDIVTRHAAPALERLARAEQKYADMLEDAARQSCHTHTVEKDYNGQVAGSKVTDSGAISTYGDMLHELGELGRFRIVVERGRMVVGYWPENDPALNPAQVPGASPLPVNEVRK